MSYLPQFIDKVITYKSWSDKKKIDALLEYDCNLYTNLGSNSTKKEILAVKKQSKSIYRAIGKIDRAEGKKLMMDIDVD